EEWRLAKFPFMLWWLVLLVLLCLSYLKAPLHQEHLTDPIRVTYQLLRYCLRPIAYLPLILVLIRSAHRTYTAMLVIQVAALQVTLMAVKQGLTGMSATPGPFLTGNQLGGVLLMPTMMAVVGAVLPRTRFQFILSAISLPLIARALLYSESRGAQVSLFAGCLFFAVMLVTQHVGRRRLQWLSPMMLIGFVAILPAMPLILSRPSIKHALSASEASEDSNMKWRIEERWPHFWAIALENPIFGVGTEVDASLGPKANTPHNGYLAMVVLWGFPAAGIVILLALRTLWNGVVLYRRARRVDHRLFGLTVSSAMAAILTHQIVEVTLIHTWSFKVFWFLLATSELAKRWPDDDDEAPAYFLTRRQLHGFESPTPPAAPVAEAK
ncbi:MAG: O-antigen ligase family protein, partial [Acidobacteriota bacterium]